VEKEELDLRFREGVQLKQDQLALVQQALKNDLGEEDRSDWGPQEDDAGACGGVCAASCAGSGRNLSLSPISDLIEERVRWLLSGPGHRWGPDRRSVGRGWIGRQPPRE